MAAALDSGSVPAPRLAPRARRTDARRRPASRCVGGARPAARGQTSCRGTSGKASSSSSSTSAAQVERGVERQHVVLALGVERRRRRPRRRRRESAPVDLRAAPPSAAGSAGTRAPTSASACESQRGLDAGAEQRRALALQPASRRRSLAAVGRRRRSADASASQPRSGQRPASEPAAGGEGGDVEAARDRMQAGRSSRQCRRRGRRARRDGTIGRCPPGASSSPRPRAIGASCCSACACRSRCAHRGSTRRPLRRRSAGGARPAPGAGQGRAVADRDADAVVIGSDQVADLDGAADRQARRPRRARPRNCASMRGRTRRLPHRGGRRLREQRLSRRARLAPVTVRFRDLSDAEIEHYLRAEQPYDCAGSAKAETLGIALLEAIESDDPTALIGLPLIRTCALLRAAGIDPLAPRRRRAIRHDDARARLAATWCRTRSTSAPRARRRRSTSCCRSACCASPRGSSTGSARTPRRRARS